MSSLLIIFFFWSRALYGRYLISYRVKTALYTELLRYYIQVFCSIKELVLREKLSASPITIYSSKIACLVYMAFRISCLDPSWNGNAWKTYRGWKLCPVSPLPLWRVFENVHRAAQACILWYLLIMVRFSWKVAVGASRTRNLLPHFIISVVRRRQHCLKLIHKKVHTITPIQNHQLTSPKI